MAIKVLYRKSSGEVLKISRTRTGSGGVEIPPQKFEDADPKFYGVLTDPTGDFPFQYSQDNRQLGKAVHADDSLNVVRLSTQAEIDAYPQGEADTESDMDVDGAKRLLEVDPQFRRAFVAFAKLMLGEINTLRQAAGMQPRTLNQLKTAMRNAVSRDD